MAQLTRKLSVLSILLLFMSFSIIMMVILSCSQENILFNPLVARLNTIILLEPVPASADVENYKYNYSIQQSQLQHHNINLSSNPTKQPTKFPSIIKIIQPTKSNKMSATSLTQINQNKNDSSNTNKHSKYSSFVCIGGDTDKKINNYRKNYNGELVQHSCHFKNICYSNRLHKWLYYAETETETETEIIQTEQDDINYSFNTTRSSHGFLIIHSMRDTSITPQIINKPFPDLNNIYVMFNKTVIYHYLQWVYNFGHVLTDNYYAMYRALYYFHLYNPSSSSSSSCCQPLFNYFWIGAGFDEKGIKIPIKFINALNEYIFNGSSPIFLGFDSRKEHGRQRELETIYESLFPVDPDDHSDNLDLACFKNIVIGTDDFRIWWKAVNRKFHHRWDFSNFIDLFRKNSLHIDRYNKYLNVSRHKILFISKGFNERRRWTEDTNLTYIIEYLYNLFGVQIDSKYGYEIYVGKSLTEQIDFILQYSLVITACGAVSYIGAFMRSGTAMITVDYWHVIQNKTSHIDSYIWEYCNDRKTYYYYIKQNEWKMPKDWKTPIRGRSKDGKLLWNDVRNDADYKLKAPRLSRFVYSALLWIEHYNGWTDTFKRPTNFKIDEID